MCVSAVVVFVFLSLSVLFNLHAAAGLIGSIFPPAARQQRSVCSASVFARRCWKLEMNINTFLGVVWTRWGCSWEISIPSGVKTEPSFPGLLVICITGKKAHFTIFEHQDAHSVFWVHVCGVFKPFRTSYFLCLCFGFDTKVIIEPVEPSRLFYGVSWNSVYLMMELIYFRRCWSDTHLLFSDLQRVIDRVEAADGIRLDDLCTGGSGAASYHRDSA